MALTRWKKSLNSLSAEKTDSAVSLQSSNRMGRKDDSTMDESVQMNEALWKTRDIDSSTQFPSIHDDQEMWD